MRKAAPSSPDAPASVAADMLRQMRARSPRVHCITNNVAQNFTANVLLALGCVPSMTLSSEEIGAFIGRADALLVNLGTFDRERREATAIAIEAARRENIPWVLDPVFVDRAPPRVLYAKELIAQGAHVVRLNHAEFSALSGSVPTREALKSCASKHKGVVALSGETDLVTDGERMAAIGNGHPLMAKVTAMGCAGSAVVAACLAFEPDAWRATVAALVIMGVAGELAAETAQGPGSFAVAIVDALYNLDARTLRMRAKVS